MRRKLIAGNWKMNLRRAAAVELARGIVLGSSKSVAELLVCPPFGYLGPVAEVLAGSAVGLGAQNVCAFPDGAFTGEMSCGMLTDLGCRYVILGHSERRIVFGETDAVVNAKLSAALEHELTPIVCLGEQLAEREGGRTFDVLRSQFEGTFREISAEQMGKIVLAYEPVWAIGTGRVATPEQAQEVHADLRKRLESRYNSQLAGQIRILYGGSVKPENARRLLEQPDIDGALIGGASLDGVAFLAIAEASGDH